MQTSATPRLSGMTGFSFVWAGQLVSVLATNMTHFALSIFIFQQAGEAKATAMGLLQVFFITPFLLISPIAGVMVDRYNRKLMMMVSDLGAGLATVAILLLQAAGQLQIWHLYVAAIVGGIGNAFQWPAYSAAISTMLPKEQYGRANGMMALVEMGPGVLAPIFAGALLPLISLTGIMLVDVITFVTAIGTLLLVHVPQPPRTAAGREGQGSLLKEAAYGFRYIFARPSLLGLQMVFFFGNLFSGIGLTVLAPMVLSRTNENTVIFGAVQTAGAIGGVVGGVIMSAWGGFKRKVHGVLLGWILSSLCGMVLLGFGQGPSLWIPAIILTTIFGPLINGSNQAIWQAKVAPDVQGRVFSARRLIAWFTNPISPIIAGTLADFVLEPAMREGGALAGLFGGLIGVGPGAGMGLLLIITGALAALVGVAGYFIPAVRNAESLLPDHDALVPAEPALSAAS